MNRERINEFVNSISDVALTKLFRCYNLGHFDHLLQNQRNPTKKWEERQALRDYMSFVKHNVEESERRTKLTACVQSKDETKLLELIFNDQVSEEVLVEAINTRDNIRLGVSSESSIG